MKFSNIANVVDVEHQNGCLIEIGLTTVNLTERRILKSYCMPIKVEFEISPEITQLTGWTNAKLNKQGMEEAEALRFLQERYGFTNRLLVTDMSEEIPFLEQALGAEFSYHRLNVSILFALATGERQKLGLEEMLAFFGMSFEGRPHSGVADSRNIARLFLKVMLPLFPAGLKTDTLS